MDLSKLKEQLAAYDAAKSEYNAACSISPNHTTPRRRKSVAKMNKTLGELQVYARPLLTNLVNHIESLEIECNIEETIERTQKVAKDKFKQYFVIYRKYNDNGLEIGALPYDNATLMLSSAAYLRTCEDVIEVEIAMKITQAEALNQAKES